MFDSSHGRQLETASTYILPNEYGYWKIVSLYQYRIIYV